MRGAIALLFGSMIALAVGCSGSETPPRSETPAPADATDTAAEPASQEEGEATTEEEGEATTDGGPVMDENTGIALGQKALAFELKDQSGQLRSLDDFLAQGNVALVFYRSADW